MEFTVFDLKKDREILHCVRHLVVLGEKVPVSPPLVGPFTDLFRVETFDLHELYQADHSLKLICLN